MPLSPARRVAFHPPRLVYPRLLALPHGIKARFGCFGPASRVSPSPYSRTSPSHLPRLRPLLLLCYKLSPILARVPARDEVDPEPVDEAVCPQARERDEHAEAGGRSLAMDQASPGAAGPWSHELLRGATLRGQDGASVVVASTGRAVPTPMTDPRIEREQNYAPS